MIAARTYSLQKNVLTLYAFKSIILEQFCIKFSRSWRAKDLLSKLNHNLIYVWNCTTPTKKTL